MSKPPERPSQPSNILSRVPNAPKQDGAVLFRNYSEPRDSNNESSPYTYTEPCDSRNVSSDNKRHGRHFGDDLSAITDAQVSSFSGRENSDHGNNNDDTSRWHLGGPKGGI